MFATAFLSIFVVASVSCCTDGEWLRWRNQYNKVYESTELEQIHRQAWEQNRAYVQKHYEQESVIFTVGLNQFADQFDVILSEGFLGYSKQMTKYLAQGRKKTVSLVRLEPPQIELIKRPVYEIVNVKDNQSIRNRKLSKLFRFVPSEVDWRKKGAVSPVKTQGPMADSEAIVAAECVESFHEIQTGSLVDLSSAEVHDCCTPTPIVYNNVFQCIHDIGGLCSEGDYPAPTGKCRNDSCSAAAQITGGSKVRVGNEDDLKEAVAKTPVLAVIDAGLTSFQLYTGGIYSDPQCTSSRLDHVVQVVGYGSMDDKDFWICKNSWGASWGIKGYILIARNMGNMCGIASNAMYPV